jgi:hypothetical protein
MTCFLIGLICILIGGSTASGYPPFDPSVWLMMFGVGMIAPYFSEDK